MSESTKSGINIGLKIMAVLLGILFTILSSLIFARLSDINNKLDDYTNFKVFQAGVNAEYKYKIESLEKQVNENKADLKKK